MTEQPTYQYFAFISFQNSDAREAVRLQHAIESYRLPAVLCKQNTDIPKRIKPLYCYLNDMHSGEELMQELKARMEQSRYLIVVCSPRSARSVYVNSGIDYFVSLGRRDSIIPVIVDGVPYSENPETECFPEALKRHFPKHADPLQDHSILGINLREAGVSRRKSQDRAMLMVVARMLQLDYDGLLLREQQRRRKRSLLTAFLTLMVAAALCLTWHFSQTVDVKIAVREATPHNDYLPQNTNIALRLYLKGEQKSDTLSGFENATLLHHIPPRYIGYQVRITLAAKDYLPVDTAVALQKEMCLPLSRDPKVYGHIHFRILGLPSAENKPVRVGDYTAISDSGGIVELDIPIENQRTQYPVLINNYADTLYMPCGDDVVIVAEP